MTVVVLVVQSRKTNELRRELSAVVERKNTLESRQRDENSNVEEPTFEDQETLQRNIEHLRELRSTRDHLRAQVERSLKQTLASKAASRPEPESIPWRNQGSAKPVSTVETVLWSIAHGDVDTLATLIAFDDDARDQAARLYDVLPEDLRGEYKSPESLVAALMAIEKPVTSLNSVNVLGESSPGPNRDTLHLAASSGQISLNFRRDASGWKLLVPALVVDGYRHYAIGTLSLAESPP